MQEPSVTICLRGMRKAICEAGWGVLVNVWLHITHVLTPTWFICCVFSEVFDRVVVYPPLVDICQPSWLLLIRGRCQVSVRWIVPNVPPPQFQPRRYSRFSGSSSGLRVYPHSCPRSFLIPASLRDVAWDTGVWSQNMDTYPIIMTRLPREAAMFRWWIKICGMIPWSSYVSSKMI